MVCNARVLTSPVKPDVIWTDLLQQAGMWTAVRFKTSQKYNTVKLLSVTHLNSTFKHSPEI